MPPAAAGAAITGAAPAPPPAPAPQQQQRRHRVLMVTDFFYPNFGGVENHVYQLSQCLLDQGHKVVVMTHAYGDCGGVRYLTNGLKVYYLYRRPIHAQSTLPTWVGAFRLLRLICLREGITLVHAHQAFSTLGGEALLQARTMGYQVVFTDHSLFGFADASSILTNKLIKGLLADVQHVVCVSHTSKENTVLRACLHPGAVSVIPNAVDASEFQPGPARRWPRPRSSSGDAAHTPAHSSSNSSSEDEQPAAFPTPDPITIVALSRLVYRKGVDIMALVIPEVCHRHPHVNWLIGGDGPKRALLEQMVAAEGLAGRVTLAGAIPHDSARDFLLQGHVFVNASLTEAFCMAIVEAASVGLVVVSTRVGGVPEVLPPDMVLLAEPSPADLLAAVEAAIARVPHTDPVAQHARVREMYSWPNVAQRTAAVYDRLAAAAAGAAGGCPQPVAPDASARIAAAQRQLLPRLRRYRGIGPWAGLVMCCIALWLHWFWLLLEWSQPAGEVDVAPDWPALGGSGGGGDATCEGQQQQQQGGGVQGQTQQQQQQQQQQASRGPHPPVTRQQPPQERGADDARAPSSRYSLRSARSSTPSTAAKRLN